MPVMIKLIKSNMQATLVKENILNDNMSPYWRCRHQFHVRHFYQSLRDIYACTFNMETYLSLKMYSLTSMACMLLLMSFIITGIWRVQHCFSECIYCSLMLILNIILSIIIMLLSFSFFLSSDSKIPPIVNNPSLKTTLWYNIYFVTH